MGPRNWRPQADRGPGPRAPSVRHFAFVGWAEVVGGREAAVFGGAAELAARDADQRSQPANPGVQLPRGAFPVVHRWHRLIHGERGSGPTPEPAPCTNGSPAWPRR